MTYKYRFSMTPLIDRDVVVLQLFRSTYDGKGVAIAQHYLSSKGWRRYKDFDYLEDLIEISGREMSAPLMEVCRHIESLIRPSLEPVDVV